MKRILLALSLLLFTGLSLHAQEERLIQLSGVVVSGDSLEQMPYVTIYDRTSKHGTVGDYFGFFSVVVEPGDTIFFGSLGYEQSSYIVPDTLKEARYSIIHMMHVDTIKYLPNVTIYPWPSREAFAKAFVEMDVTDDAVRRAQRELSGESLAFIAARVSTDGSLSYSYAMNQQNTRLYTIGQSPVNNLFNPVAWSKFISAWKNGQLRQQ